MYKNTFIFALWKDMKFVMLDVKILIFLLF